MTEDNNQKNDEQLNDQPVVNEELDVGSQSLTNALKTSFAVLKVIMVVLVVIFLFSGAFRVEEDENALVLTFGEVRGTGTEERILKPGFQLVWPEPIQEVVVVPVKKVQDVIIDSFWYFQTEQELLGTRPPRIQPFLDPIQDGYCLTRNDSLTGKDGTDYNIVHAKWKLTYRIVDLEKFFSNIYYRAPKPGEDFLDVVEEDVEPLLKALTDNVIVTTMAKYSIDQAIVSDDRIGRDVQRLLQAKLDELNSGISVEAMEVIGRITWPRQVNEAFEKENKAKQESAKIIKMAHGQADVIIAEAGGPDAEYILDALVKDDITPEQKTSLLEMLKGKCQTKIAEAYAYRTKVVKDAEADADYLKSLLTEYRKRPKLVIQEIYQNAIKKVMDNADEKIFLQPTPSDQPKELRVLINRNPKIGKTKESGQEKNK